MKSDDGIPPSSGESMRAALERQLSEDSAGAQNRVPPSIPDHVLLRRIGTGAYGDVWLARNALGTLRAVKIIHRARFKEDRPYEREFHGILKYEPVSRTHEGLVQVLHVGRNDAAGYFFYVMELADPASSIQYSVFSNQSRAPRVPQSQPDPPNTDLLNTDSLVSDYSPRTLRSELAQRTRLPPTDAARFVLRLASALAHLHAQGLVHRDIKPSNIIFVGGEPKLADIGLVTDVGTSQSFVGTEGFIPPEGPGTPQADLYGLGKLLYELATGRDRMEFPQLPPLSLLTKQGIKRTASPLTAALSPLRGEGDAGVSDADGEALLELNEVMTRACAPEPKNRYTTATELQAELNLFLAGRSLRHSRNLERTLARLKRFAVAACLFLVVAAGAIWFFKNEERHAKERAGQATERVRLEVEGRAKESTLRQRAEAAERSTQQQLYTALLEQARATVRSGELGQRVRALEAIRRAAAISNSVELRREVVAALALPDLRFERELPYGLGAYGAERMVVLDPALERVALSAGKGPVEIRSVSDNRLLATLPAGANLEGHYARWSPDGRFLAIKRDRGDGQFSDWEVWDVPIVQRKLLLRNLSYIAISFHPYLPRLLAEAKPEGAAIWDLENGQELLRLPLSPATSILHFSPDGERFGAVSIEPGRVTLSVCEITNGAKIVSHRFNDTVTDFAWHPRGRWLAVPGHNSTVQRMDAQTGEVSLLGRHKVEAVKAVFSPDGAYLFTGGWEREFICWDVRTMRRAFTVNLNAYVIQISTDGRRCAAVMDSGVQLRLLERPVCREFAEDVGGGRNHAAFSSDGHWLAASGGERLMVWDLNRDGPGASPDQARNTRLQFAQNGDLIADRPGTYFRWSVTPGAKDEAPYLKRLDFGMPAGFISLCLVSNGAVFTGASGSKLAPVDQLAPTQGPWAPSIGGMNGASPDNQWLGMYRAFSSHLYVHRLPGLEQVAKLTNEARISHFQFSPLGDELAVASQRAVEFWSTSTWQRTRSLTNFTGINYSPDGHTFWLWTDFRTAGLYDARTVDPLLPLPANTLPLAVSPDGHRVAVSVDQRRVQVWDVAEVRARLLGLGLDWAGSQ